MEMIGENLQPEKLKSQTAIRCAKAAILLSSVKNATKNLTTDVSQFQDEGKIEKLMIELVKERAKLKRLRHWIMISLLLLFIVLFIFLNSLLFAF